MQDHMSHAKVYEADDDNQTELNVFSPSYSKIFDERAKEYGKLLQHQSDRDLPRTYFAQGIIPSDGKLKKNKKKFAAHEQQGCMLVVLLILQSEQADYFEKHMGKEKLAAFISLFEKCILLENLLQAECLTTDDVEVIGKYIPLLMDLYKRSINRKEGMGNKFVKFHLIAHLYDDLKRNGVCQNTTSGPGESRHKIACKQPARNTQRIADLFEGQLGAQYADNVVIDRTEAEFAVTYMKDKDMDMPYVNNLNTVFQSKRFFYEDGCIYDYTKRISNNEFERSSQWDDPKLLESVEDFIECNIAPFVDDARMDLYTICKHKGTIYRASPLYKDKFAWNDWAYIDASEMGIIAANFILFLKITGLKKTLNHSDFPPIERDGIYAIAHILPVPLTDKPIYAHYGKNHKAHQGSLLFHYSQKKLRTRQRGSCPSLVLLDTDYIASPCISVPDLDAKKQPHSFLFLKSRCHWQKIFLDHMREEISDEGFPGDSNDDEGEEDSEENGEDNNNEFDGDNDNDDDNDDSDSC